MKILPLFYRSVTGETANAGTVLSLGLDQAGIVPDYSFCHLVLTYIRF
jgi:hypothetical protein